MPYISKEELEQIKGIDVLSYLHRFNPGNLVKISGGTYSTREHDSLKISNGKWYWWSRGIGGKNALDYMTRVEGRSFYNAAEFLLRSYNIQKSNQNGYSSVNKHKEKDLGLVLPEQADNNEVIIRYLLGRGISRNVIDYCIKNQYIYQSKPMNNLVFVGFNSAHKPKYATVRGTGEERFFIEPYGSDKKFSFRILNSKSKDLHLFEGAIDLLSFATLIDRAGQNFKGTNMLSLGGISEKASRIHESVEKYLMENSDTEKIFLHFDNDEPGIKAADNYMKLLGDKYKVVNSPVPYGKDVNEYLQEKINKERSCER